MKSEKAKKLLDVSSLMGDYGYRYAHFDCAVKAVELAEQEAEERMREKAIDAFRSSCKYQDGCRGAHRKCDPRQCEDLKSFIQKLNE